MTLTWVELIPYVSALAAMVTLGIKIGRLLQKLDNVIEDVKEIKKELKEHGERIAGLEAIAKKEKPVSRY